MLSGGDYDSTIIGATPGRFAALKSGAADASLLIPPILFQAEDAGFRKGLRQVELDGVAPGRKDIPHDAQHKFVLHELGGD